MPTYRYETKNASGQVTAGVINAANLAAASAQIRGRGEYILALAPAEDPTKKKQVFSLNISFGPGAKDVQNFTSQLAVMIRAGISIRAAIEGISDQVENPKFKTMLQQMKRDVEGGKQFSDALTRFPKVFSPLYINMVKASELSGGFSRMLDKIAAYLAQQIETKSMVRGAMIYPGIIGTMAIGTTIFLLTFVLPRFMLIFNGKELTWPRPKSPLLPRPVVQMISAGEESGKLGEVLDEVSEFYSRELKAVIKSVTAMIEPLMIVIMGGMVGFIAMSIILPIFKLSSIVK